MTTLRDRFDLLRMFIEKHSENIHAEYIGYIGNERKFVFDKQTGLWAPNDKYDYTPELKRQLSRVDPYLSAIEVRMSMTLPSNHGLTYNKSIQYTPELLFDIHDNENFDLITKHQMRELVLNAYGLV